MILAVSIGVCVSIAPDGPLAMSFRLEREALDDLLEALRQRQYTVLGPVVQGGALIYGPIASSESLPIGWGDNQAPGSYRLKKQQEDVVFGTTVSPHSWKKFLFPPILNLFTARRSGKSSEFELSAPSSNGSGRYAFFGMRPCDLHALAILDRVFTHAPNHDPYYSKLREELFVVAANCTAPAGTCFCASMKTGPKAIGGYDLSMTEVIDASQHYFVVEVGSEQGKEVLGAVPHRPAEKSEVSEAEMRLAAAAVQMGRTLETDNLKEILSANSEHPRWDAVAARCLTCANCTMVCPTCFCTTVEDVTDLTGTRADRVRKWDSCFTLEFSYIHGGSVRSSAKARYRQWLTHKLSSWVDQFGTFGCVGCGRCITWCPVGIDITEEARAIREHQA